MKRILTLTALIASTLGALAQGTAFTYQGRLNDGANPASGVYDFQFALLSSNGSQVGSTVSSSGVAVSNGLFTVTLDFGNQFPGAARLLEIAVRTNGFTSFTTLAPRQPLTPTPYAITASNLSGTLPLAQLPAAAVTNGAGGVNLTGTFTGNGAGVSNVNAATLNGIPSGNFWQLDGNNVSNGQFLGSTNSQPVELRVNNQRGLRLETGGSNSVNVIGGYAGNYIAPGVAGATVAGGGAGSFSGNSFSNRVEADFGSVGGGSGNIIQSGAYDATIGGGGGNIIRSNAAGSAISGGIQNLIQASASDATIGGGVQNRIESDANFATIGGGDNNTIQPNSPESIIGGGYINTIQPNSPYSTIGGGGNNTIQPNSHDSTIGGGFQNTIQTNSPDSTIGGGGNNSIQMNSGFSIIGGGGGNTIQTASGYATIGGGYANTIQTNATDSTIGGGGENTIQPNSVYSTIGGGGNNTILMDSVNSTIGGGINNTIQTNSPDSTIGGGGNNSIQRNSLYSTVGGGLNNNIQAVSYDSTIGGGLANTIQTASYDSTISGGNQNAIQMASDSSTIGGGYQNTIQPNSPSSTIGGGVQNLIESDANFATIGGGYTNTILANSYFSTVPGGANNTAGSYAFAAGNRAKAVSLGAFVWADSQDADFTSTAANQFLVRAAGGVGINTPNPVVPLTVQGSGVYNAIGAAAIAVKNSTANKTWEWHVLDDGRMQFADLTAGATRMLIDTSGNVSATSFNPTSDRNAKENFAAVSASEILAKVAALPITRWNFKEDERTAHIGPMAQDFYSAFGTGMDDRHIATVDADGVALAAIQGLNEKGQKSAVRIQKSESRIQKLETENTELKSRLEKLEQLFNTQGVTK